MTISQVKIYLSCFNALKLKVLLWENQPVLRTDIENQKRYETMLLQVTILEQALTLLNNNERFIIEAHLISHKSWNETALLFEEKWGRQNGLSDRTYKRIQSRALLKIFDFITSLDTDEIFQDITYDN